VTRDDYEHLGDRAELWRAFKEKKDPEARESLILAYIELVKYVSGQMAMGMPAEIQPSDLETYGIFGLMDALDKFDVSRKIKFETYAVMRIRGAILDGVRNMDWVPASVRRRSREIRDAHQALRSELGRQATDEEVARYLGISPERLRKDSAQLARTTMVYLDEARTTEEVSNVDTLLNSIPDEKAADPFEETSWRAQKELLAEAIGDLKEQEQLVITLYYYEGLTLSEIAEVMELSPSRISQVHSRAVSRLRGKLSADRELFLMSE
jgi:RNA polymerase sigma factor FliA